MGFSKINLYQELKKVKQKQPTPSIVEEVYEILSNELEKDQQVLNQILGKKNTLSSCRLELEEDLIFNLQQIKFLCIKFRLRFLDAKLYKGEIPYEAILKVKDLEKQFGVEISDFKIIAPKELFKLEDKDSDPMLFANLGNDQFYFIHKWGRDMTFARSLMAIPFRNVETMFFTLLGISVIFSTIVPTPNTMFYLFLIVHSFIAICGIACMLIMMFRENFSDIEWDSKYLS